MGKARRWMRRSAAAAKAGWYALRTGEAVVLHRPVPHWQLWGIHRVMPDLWGPRLEVALDLDAGKWLAVGEADAIEVWLGTAGTAGRSGGNAPLAVYRGDERVDVLSADADAAYRPRRR